jgi:hypothetical protein
VTVTYFNITCFNVNLVTRAANTWSLSSWREARPLVRKGLQTHLRHNVSREDKEISAWREVQLMTTTMTANKGRMRAVALRGTMTMMRRWPVRRGEEVVLVTCVVIYIVLILLSHFIFLPFPLAAQQEVARRANDLVRLALFTEQKRVPLKRDEISKKGWAFTIYFHRIHTASTVLGANKRSFNEVLANAQDILKKTFGMELVELKSRAAEEEDGEKRKNANDEELEEARNATGIKKRGACFCSFTFISFIPITAVTGSKTYILRSVLDPIIIEHAALTDEAILAEEATEFHADDDEDEEPGVRSYGSIIAWSSGDQLAPLGILHVILALILVSGRVMSDGNLSFRAYTICV